MHEPFHERIHADEWHRRECDQLRSGLELHERMCASDATARLEMDVWRRAMKQKMPTGSTFTGRAACYTYTDVKRIRKHLFHACSYASLQNQGLQYLVAVRCFGFFGGASAVWVYYGVCDTSLLT